jgi:hypothetical protein
MANFIIINGSRIANVIVADSLEDATTTMTATNMGNHVILSDSAPEGWNHSWSWNGSTLVPPVSNDAE